MKTYLTAQGRPFKIISDIGGGTGYNKKGLQELIKLISENQVEKVVVLYKDRLLGFGFEEDITQKSENEGTRIDTRVKDLAVCPDGNTYKNINKIPGVKKIEKKRRLQRTISRKYEINKEGESYKKTCNIIKSERKVHKIQNKLNNIRKNCINKATTELLSGSQII